MVFVPEAADDGREGAAGSWLAGLGTVLREWGRIGITGFGGAPGSVAAVGLVVALAGGPRPR